MTTPTIHEVITKIEREALEHSADARLVRGMPVGKHARQGDTYLLRIEAVPAGVVATDNRQLAPGTTQGSRHVLEGKARVWRRKDATPLQGPIIEALERCIVTHPEHAHISIPSGLYEVIYQRDYEQEELAAVKD